MNPVTTSPVHAPTNRGPYDSTTPYTQRESKEKQETTETRTRHIPLSCFPSVERPLWSGDSNSKCTAQ